jgi:phage shock protein A
MTLITRVSRLFRADMHAVLDRIEEPEVLLRQAVREMKEDLAGDEQRIKRLNYEYGQLTARQDDLTQSLADIEQELDVCFDSGKGDLARSLIRRKLEAQQFLRFLARRREILEETLSGLKARLKENRTRLESIRQKAELLAAENSVEPSRDNWGEPDSPVRDEDVEVAFLREQQKRRSS